MRFLLLGRGCAGKRHERILRRLGHDVITIDTDPSAGADFQSVPDLSMGQLPDGVLDCTPPTERPWWSYTSRYPVFVEKPLGKMALSTRAAAESPPPRWRVQMGFNFRWDSRLEHFVKIVKERVVSSLLIAGGQYIQDWHTEDYRAARQRYHGVVTDSLPHSVYIARWILGDVEYCGSTTAKVGGLELDAEDTAGVLLRGPNGEPALLVADYLRRLRTFHIDAVTRDGGWYRWEFAPKEAQAMHERQMRKFVQLCEGHLDAGYPDLADGIAVQKILEQIKEKQNERQ